MKYEKDLMASWDEYSVKKTIEHDLLTAKEKGREEGLQEGRQEGKKEGKKEGVSNLLLSGKFTMAEIANFMNVSETFVRTIKKDLK